MGRRLRHSMSAEQVRSALKLVEPLGEMLELTHLCLEAHHPEGVGAAECAICLRFQEEMQQVLERWGDAKARAMEHWDVGER